MVHDMYDVVNMLKTYFGLLYQVKAGNLNKKMKK